MTDRRGVEPPPTRREDERAVRNASDPAATRREATGDTTRREGAEAGGPTSAGDRWLPPALRARFPQHELLEVSGGEADCYRLGNGDQIAFAKVYHRGKQPDFEVLERLNNVAADQVVKLLDYAPATPTERAWELLEFAPEGSLLDLIGREGPKLPSVRVRQIVEEITAALSAVHGRNIEHRDLKPANVLVRSLDPFDLVLADFGIASVMDETWRQTSAHHTASYGPPEAISGGIEKQRWDSWSLGIMIVEMLIGEHPFTRASAISHGERAREALIRSALAISDFDDLVHDVEGADWKKLCRGLLRRNPKLRWTTSEVRRWLDGDTSLTVAPERVAKAAPLFVDGKPYESREELAAAVNRSAGFLPELWRGRQNELRNWLQHDLGDPAGAGRIEQLVKASLPRDLVLAVLHNVLAPDVAISFKNFAMTPAGLAAMATAAGAGDGDAGDGLLALRKDDALAALAKIIDDDALAAIYRDWRNAVADYERESGKLLELSNRAANPPKCEGQTLIHLLAAATPGAGAAKHLMDQTRARLSPAAASSLWLQQFGAPQQERSARNLLIIFAASVAEAQVNAAAANREAGNFAMWKAMARGGAIGGGVGLAAWWGGAGQGWLRQSLNGFDIAFLVAAVVGATALLASVHQQTTRRV